ncbi:MAG: hypothetical protein KAS12_01860 [Candidatus Aenigmarchaeota archaeon]|nr:hypothetical protein [Candidatus Aenigmarchaeota archaeon]
MDIKCDICGQMVKSAASLAAHKRRNKKCIEISKTMVKNLQIIPKIEPIEPVKSEIEPIEPIKSEIEPIEPIKSEIEPIKSEIEPIKSEIEPVKSEIEDTDDYIEKFMSDLSNVKEQEISFEEKVDLFINRVDKNIKTLTEQMNEIIRFINVDFPLAHSDSTMSTENSKINKPAMIVISPKSQIVI